MDFLKKIIGENIRKARKAKHLSQEQLAEKIGTSPQYIGDLETGKYIPKKHTEKLCSVLGISQEDLINNNPSSSMEQILSQMAERLDSIDASLKEIANSGLVKCPLSELDRPAVGSK